MAQCTAGECTYCALKFQTRFRATDKTPVRRAHLCPFPPARRRLRYLRIVPLVARCGLKFVGKMKGEAGPGEARPAGSDLHSLVPLTEPEGQRGRTSPAWSSARSAWQLLATAPPCASERDFFGMRPRADAFPVDSRPGVPLAVTWSLDAGLDLTATVGRVGSSPGNGTYWFRAARKKTGISGKRREARDWREALRSF